LASPTDNYGTPHPRNIPSAIAANIQRVKYLSKNDNFDDLLFNIIASFHFYLLPL